MNLYSTASLIASTTCIALGLYVYLKNRSEAINAAFALLTGLAGIWAAFLFLTAMPSEHDRSLFLARLVYLFAAFVPAASCYFIFVLGPRTPSKTDNTVLGFLLFISLGFASTTFNPYLIADILRTPPAVVVVPGMLYIPFMLFVGLGSGYALYRGFRNCRGIVGARRNQLKFILISFLIAYTAALLHFLSAYIGVEPIPHDFLMILFALLIGYAIIKHRVMDITVVMKEGLVHSVTIGLVLVPSSMVFLLILTQTDVPLSHAEAGIIFTLMALIAIAAYTIKTSTKDTIARTLFRSRYDMYDTLSNFSRALVTILDLKTLTAEIVDTLAKVIGISTASLYLLDNEKNAYILSSSYNPTRAHEPVRTLNITDALPFYLARSHAIVVRDDVDHGTHARPLVDSMKTMDAEVCIPLVNHDILIGFCSLGARTNHSMYSDDDLRLLTTLGHNAAIALDNAKLYEERKRSQILMHRAHRLRSMETIAAGFAHEIRNPLTSIKTFIQLAPQRKDDPEFNGYFYRVAADDVARIERLIQEILDYSRSREPDFKKEDLNDIVASSLYFIELNAYRNAMVIEKEFATDLPRVTLDRQQIKQVLLNLFLNAMDAMQTPGSRLQVKTHRIMKPDEEEWVQIEVADSGTGIPPINLERIFDPFYSTKHQSTDREGTGLGLTIVHQIVQDHHGYIDVSSQPGTGTTFFVNLPVIQPQLKPQPGPREQSA